MAVSIVDLKIVGVKTFANDTFEVGFRNEKRVFKEEIDRGVVTNLAGTNYRNNVIAVAGINASGKSTALRLIDFAVRVFIQGQSLNECEGIIDILRDRTDIHAHLMYENKLMKLHAVVVKDKETVLEQLIFEEESFAVKKLASTESKGSFLNFSKIEYKQVRSELDDSARQFLKEEDSMVPSFFPEDIRPPKQYMISRLDSVNRNILNVITMFSKELLEYLDPSIEELTLNKHEKQTSTKPVITFVLKFYGEDPMDIPFGQLGNYLSSGTIRGLNIYTQMIQSFVSGGYYIIDELENHFNKAIVESIISLYQSKVNSKGSTLIFSTHYSEILDTIERKEAIKVLRKNKDGIHIDSLASLANSKGKDRTDIDSSTLVLSGIFDTAPSYEKYIALSKKIDQFVNEEDNSGGSMRLKLEDLSGFIALIGEGRCEATYLSMLLDDERLIFTRKMLINEEVLDGKYRKGKKFQEDILRFGYSEPINVILVQDRDVRFKLSRPYDERIRDPIYVLTKPELEMLMIHHLDLFDEYGSVVNRRKGGIKPSEFVAEKQGLKTSVIKGRDFINELFTAETLVTAIRKYDQKAPRRKKNEYRLIDLLK